MHDTKTVIGVGIAKRYGLGMVSIWSQGGRYGS